MSMLKMDQGEPVGKEDKIEEIIELNNHAHYLTMNLQLPVAGDYNNKIKNESEHWHGTSGNANDTFFLWHGHEKKQAALMKAVLSRNVEEVKLLLLNCQLTDDNSITRDGTALLQLVRSECEVKTCSTTLEIMKLLLQNGSHTCSDQSNELSVLCIATRAGRVDIVHLLCEHDVELNELCNNQTALMIAAELGNLEVVEILLDHGASVNIQNNMKLDAFHIALKFDHVDCAKLLLDRGARKDISMEAKIAVENKQSAAFQFIGSLYKDKDYLLRFAIKIGRHDYARYLIDIGADVKKKSSDGKTPLRISLESQKGESFIRYLIKNGTCANDFMDFVLLLLQNGAHTCSDQSDKLRVLCIATRAGRVDIVRLLCEHGVELNELCDNQTALMIAAELGNLEVVEILLDHGASVNIQNNMKLDAFHIALKFDHVDCAKLLLGRGACKDISMEAKIAKTNKKSAAFQFIGNLYKDKDDLLLFAIKIGRYDYARHLIDIGADVHKENSDRKTPLRISLESQKGESFIRYLIKNGACVNGFMDYVLLHLSRHYSFEITKLLLDSNTDAKLYQDTALITACDARLDIGIIKFLLARGEQPNMQNEFGYTALHKATLRGNIDVVKLLVESGADLESHACDNKTAYLMAASIAHLKVMQALQELGANTSAVDHKGHNALMLAVDALTLRTIARKSSILQYLVRNGTEINHQCNKGYTALMVAAKLEDLKQMHILLDLGADVNITTSISPGSKDNTALSIFLKYFRHYCPEDLTLIKEMISRGAMNSLPRVVLHKMIMWDNRRVIQLLLTNGMAPTMAGDNFVNYMPMSFYPLPVVRYIKVSPLTVALVCGNIRVAQYLVGNWVLCPCDLNFLTLKELRDYLVALHMFESVEFVEKLLCQPASLLQLSFITVSHALGGVPGREDRINSLPLPHLLKEKLMFRKEDVHMDLTNPLFLV